jgi:hypothetical protein
VLCDLTHGLDTDLCDHLEARVLPTADRRTTGQLRRRLRTLVHKLAPEQLKVRKREAVRDRRLELWDDEPSGTSALTVSGLEPVQAHGTFNQITAAARAIKADGDTRTLHQIRADLAQQLLHGHSQPEAVHLTQPPANQHPGTRDHAQARAEATAPPSDGDAASHAARDAICDAIAGLVADMADRELTDLRNHLRTHGRAHALPFRIARAAHEINDRLTSLRDTWCNTHDPAHGRTLYRPNGTMRQAAQARHITCAFPTCNQRSSRCDLDHTIPWRPGKSCLCNLAPLCRRHHRTKATPGWRLVQPWPGLLIWVTPSGNWHIVPPTRE